MIEFCHFENNFDPRVKVESLVRLDTTRICSFRVKFDLYRRSTTTEFDFFIKLNYDKTWEEKTLICLDRNKICKLFSLYKKWIPVTSTHGPLLCSPKILHFDTSILQKSVTSTRSKIRHSDPSLWHVQKLVTLICPKTLACRNDGLSKWGIEIKVFEKERPLCRSDGYSKNIFVEILVKNLYPSEVLRNDRFCLENWDLFTVYSS